MKLHEVTPPTAMESRLVLPAGLVLFLLASCASAASSEPAATGGTLSAAGGNAGNPGGAKASGGAPSVGDSGSSAAAGLTGVSPAGGIGAGGAVVTGGTAAGGQADGGSAGVKAASGSAGSSGGAAGGGTLGGNAPCDIYQAGNTPCVAAHSTVRALYGAYGGNLYQVRRASDKTTKDIGVLSPGAYANAAVQDSFCASTSCTISIIYDQSPKANHLTVTPPGGWLKAGGTEANATAAKLKIKGNTAYGVYTTGSFDEAVGGVGYRNNKTSGVATGDQPEGIYMIASGKHFNQYCCFDYGNAETNNMDNGDATMEALYFGSSTQWGKGSGTGPWVMADLENGIFAGASFAAPATNTPLTAEYVTGMLKGKPGNFVLKGGDAQSGVLKTMYDGKYPSGYSPMRKEGALVLGVGGDNSHTGQGTFFEGCVTAGYPSDETDNAVQANIVAAGYGR